MGPQCAAPLQAFALALLGLAWLDSTRIRYQGVVFKQEFSQRGVARLGKTALTSFCTTQAH